jgi:hypothetical protein
MPWHRYNEQATGSEADPPSSQRIDAPTLVWVGSGKIVVILIEQVSQSSLGEGAEKPNGHLRLIGKPNDPPCGHAVLVGEPLYRETEPNEGVIQP